MLQSMGHKESDTTEQMNLTELNVKLAQAWKGENMGFLGLGSNSQLLLLS